MSEYNQMFSHNQLRALDVTARVSSCLSVSGSSFTIISFLSYPPLRKPVNRFAFSIAVANIFACLAYSWGQYPIKAGRNSAWCQTQGFFINWFVMTDPILVMILAFNVLLTIRTKKNATELKKVDLYSVLLAFILPFIPALVFLCWRPNGKTVYGPATLWCWIAKESDILRLVAFYVPIWCFILIAIFLFALSGKQILLVRKKVKAAKADCVLQREESPTLGPDGFPPPRERRFSSFARTFIAPTTARGPGRTASANSKSEQGNPSTPAEFKGLEPLAPILSHEVLDIESHAGHDLQESPGCYEAPSFLASCPPGSPTTTLDRSGSEQAMLRCNEPQQPSRKSSSRFDRIHWKYAKFALLCTIVLFITWVPISVNRVYNNFIAPNHQIYGLYLTSAACIPLHGFGNFVIYTTTSWTECKEFLTCSGNRSSRRPSVAQARARTHTRTRAKINEKARTWADKARGLGGMRTDEASNVRRGSKSG